MPQLDEHGVPVAARPVRKWLVYLLTGICLASGIGQMWWPVSIAATQMAGTALMPAIALGAIGFLIPTSKEPYRNVGS